MFFFFFYLIHVHVTTTDKATICTQITCQSKQPELTLKRYIFSAVILACWFVMSALFSRRRRRWLLQTITCAGPVCWWRSGRFWREMCPMSAAQTGTRPSLACPAGRWSTPPPRLWLACTSSACPPGQCERLTPSRYTDHSFPESHRNPHFILRCPVFLSHVP